MSSKSTSYHSAIVGTGSYLPKRLLTNADLAKMVETSDEWIRERTGIRTRHIADASQATSDLAFEAAKNALESAGIKADQIDAILVATATPDQQFPSTACILQAKLNCRPIMSLDVSAACSGFLYALSIADQFIKNGMFKNVMVVGAEILSRIMNYNDRQTCILFGDGAGVVIVSRAIEENPSAIHSSHLFANGEFSHLLSLPGGGSKIPFSRRVLEENLHTVHMSGRDIFRAAVTALKDRCNEALAANQITVDDIQWFLFHQANIRIIDAVADALKVEQVRIPTNIANTGNTSSASIPILFDENVRSGKIKRGDKILMSAFGAGLTSASVLATY